MNTDLSHWQDWLHGHFRALATRRSGADEGTPVFALEHGLDATEVRAVAAAVQEHIMHDAPSSSHDLPWIVYATEIGYGFAGDEYWQTFEEQTPGWTVHGDRNWIRSRYQVFQKTYGGALPSGPWADQFTIICWPITNAILPRDLQRQLARILYELRHSLSADVLTSPQQLGELIRSKSWSTTSRFQSLAEQTHLVGQIATALLLQGRRDTSNLIHPSTLRRIGEDLERERQAREWLRRARSAAEDRATIRGLGAGRPTNATFQGPEEARAEVVRLGIEPHLLLRPTEGARWEVSLEIPDLSHLLRRFPHFRNILTESRCTVTGAASRPLARGRCLHGPQRITIRHWPRPDDVLLSFERTDPQLDYLLRAECMLRPGKAWLFRVASDGLAYESRGMRVRAGSKYLLVRTEPFAHSPLTRPAELTCQGVQAVILDVPAALTSEWERVLKQLQITQARSIEVWPAGLAAVTWDGEGQGEWLASETPVLAIRTDHVVGELHIAVEGDPSLSLSVTDAPPGEPIFIELPSLPVGLHRVSLVARSGAEANSVHGDLDVVMRVREFQPRLPGATAHGPLEVELDPAAPSLEQLWEGTATVLIRGPAGRKATCQVQMFARAGEAPLLKRQLPPVALPLSTEDWARHFESHFKKERDAQRVYDDTRTCAIDFSADELGEISLRFDREFTPLRWSVRRASDGFIVRLHDDVGSGHLVTERFSFERPAVGEALAASAEHAVPRAGGLYVATIGDFKATIIVPPIVKDLTDLRCEPSIDAGQPTPETITGLMSLAQLWGQARLAGDLIAGVRRRQVLRALTAHVFAVLGGQAWANAESRLRDGKVGLDGLKWSISNTNLASGLLDRYQEVAKEPIPKRVLVLAELAERTQLVPVKYDRKRAGRPGSTVTRLRPSQGSGPEYSVWLAEFSLRLASHPGMVSAWCGAQIDAALKKLLEVPTMARAARFLVLAIEQHTESLADDFVAASGEVYTGWEWSA